MRVGLGFSGLVKGYFGVEFKWYCFEWFWCGKTVGAEGGCGGSGICALVIGGGWIFFLGRPAVEVFISVAAVTSTGGSALTAGYFGKRRNAGPAQSNQRSLPHHSAPRLGEVCRSEGTPSVSEVPSGGAKRFWLLLALFQK
jgi:hypothetical protein